MRYEHSAPAPEEASEEGASDSGSQSWKGWLKWGLSSMKGYVSTVDSAHAMAFPPAPSYMSKVGTILPGAAREYDDAPAAQRSASRESPVSKVDPESSPESSLIDEQFVPYWLSNFSGETLEVRLAGSSPGGYGAPHCLEVSSGSSAPLVVRSGSPSEHPCTLR